MGPSFFFSSCAVVVTFFMLLGTIYFMFYRKLRFHQENKTLASISSPSLPLSSQPSSLSTNRRYDVFPSFHGADVRKTFLSHIMKEFKNKGINTFIDNDIERSMSIGPELIEAIRGSRIAVVLLSLKYASSSWCLNELVEIMKCRKKLGQIVMTVFYEVDPTDVKKQTGEFGKAFKKTCRGKTKEDTESWRQALEVVATIAGYHSCKCNDEASMIENMATDISNKLNIGTPSSDFDGFVGMGAHMENMVSLLRLDLDEVRMIGIWGPPGIGKASIARCLYNQVSPQFQLSAIMVNIKELLPRSCLDVYSSQLQLQTQMLSQLTNHKDIVITNLGVARERLKDKKVFLVLDDVDRLEQLDALAKEIHWFGSGSRIIITTEDQRILKAHEIERIYKVKYPLPDQALQIFCMSAFGQKSPKEGFHDLAWEATFLAGTLPLGLKVMGSYFRGMSKHEWKNALTRLRNSLHEDIEGILKFSYNALHSEDKDLFLYIACFFNRATVENVEQVLENNFLDVKQGLHILAEKSLISIENGLIVMHKLMIQLGRDIVRKQSAREPGQRQFLVHSRDICEVFSDNTTGSRNVIGITLNIFDVNGKLNVSDRAIEGMSNLQFLSFDNGHHYPNKNLYLLQCLKYKFPKLRLLRWRGFPMTCLPSTFNPEFLIELNMPESNLENLWEGIQLLSNLKWMDLSNSENLKELPDLSTATNLNKLILNGCSSLVELPFSIGNASNLKKLDLKGCSSLVKLPSSIGNATSLEKLDLSGCSVLVELPSSFGNLHNLQQWDFSGCSSLVKLPFSVRNANNLQNIYFSDCSSLVKLPSSIQNATNLKNLNLRRCSSLMELPSYIGNATNLKNLDVKECSSLVELSPSFGNLTNLEGMNFYKCSSLVKLPSSIGNLTNLQKLNLGHCSNLVELPSSIGNLTNLQKLNLGYCSSLMELPSSIRNLTNLQKLNLGHYSSLVEFSSSIGNLANMQERNIVHCSSLVELPLSIGTVNLQKLALSRCSKLVKLSSSIGNASNLQSLDLTDCSSLVKLPFSIGKAINLEELILSGCSNLVELPSSIGNMTSLKKLDLSGCSSLVELPSSIGNATKLEELYLTKCVRLVELPTSIGSATNLEILNLSHCSSLTKLPSSIGNATNLKELYLCECSSLVELPSSIENATSLEKLNLTYCLSLVKLPSSIGNFTKLRMFILMGCSSLVELPSSIGNATDLKKLDLSLCSSLVELPTSIGNLDRLYILNMQGCSKLEILPTNINMKSLDELNLTDCSLIKTFPEISTNIKYLHLVGTAIKEVPLSITSWSRLDELSMSYSENLNKFSHALDSITELNLTGTEIQEVPLWIKNISRIRRLVLSGCINVISLPQLPDSLSILDAENCESLERLDCSFQNPEIRLNFVNSFKLNQEARDLIIQTSGREVAVLPGGEVPPYFSDRATGGTLTVKLNEMSLPKSLRFKVCIVLVENVHDGTGGVHMLHVSYKITDKQNGVIVPCRPGSQTLRPALTGHLYTSDLEADVTSNELCFKLQVGGSRKWAIQECGVLQLS